MENLYRRLLDGAESLSLIGLGYVGLPIAVAFSRHVGVVGFDVNAGKIELLRAGCDPTHEVGDNAVRDCGVRFTSDPLALKECRFHIVAVPTPIKKDNTPDLTPLESASAILGAQLAEGSVVVYESTVYPGLTEELCVPILERESGLVCGRDFFVGYSPERINPGDREHRLESIVKVVSGMDRQTLDIVADVYSLVVDAGVYRAESIRVAEAAKVIENCQRDINIAFVNELSMIFGRLGIDTKSVLAAAGTKWNFLNFTPGLVGGHCIGVDPYYLTYRAEQAGYHSQVILAGRRINDSMGKYVAENTVKLLIRAGVPVHSARVAVLGLTFKENCPDIRNSKVIDIIDELREYGINPVVCDPEASPEDAKSAFGIELSPLDSVRDMHAVVLAVAHTDYAAITPETAGRMYSGGVNTPVLLDVKGVLDREAFEARSYCYWRL